MGKYEDTNHVRIAGADTIEDSGGSGGRAGTCEDGDDEVADMVISAEAEADEDTEDESDEGGGRTQSSNTPRSSEAAV
jgi:hypothetical protein